MSSAGIDEQDLTYPWLCHVCGASFRGESLVCDLCFRTVCPAHVRRTLIRSEASGLYEFVSVCLDCTAEKVIG